MSEQQPPEQPEQPEQPRLVTVRHRMLPNGMAACGDITFTHPDREALKAANPKNNPRVILVRGETALVMAEEAQPLLEKGIIETVEGADSVDDLVG